MDKFYRNLKTDDEYYTPEYAVEIIKPYVKPKSKIWCPFDKNESNYVSVFRRGGVRGSQFSHRVRSGLL